jgi:hypothetical protein
MRTSEKVTFIDKAFEGLNCPESHKKAIQRVYDAYSADCLPKGVCDPVYMLNVICKELGIGDGQSNFYSFTVNQ